MSTTSKKINNYRFKIKNIKEILLDKKSKGGSVVLDKQINKIMENLCEVDDILSKSCSLGDELENYQKDVQEYFNYIDQIERFLIA